MSKNHQAEIYSIPSTLSLGGTYPKNISLSLPKIYVIHENREWFTPLEKALHKLSLPFEEWFLHEGSVDLSGPPPVGVFYNRMSASSHTRGHRYGPELTSSVLAWLESHRRPVLNGWRAVQLEVSKVLQYEELRSVGVKTPRTIAVVGERALRDAAYRFEGPFITKHNRGGKGLGVQLFHNTTALQEHLNSGNFESPIDGITLLQEYIEPANQSITRVEFVDRKFLYAVRVDTSEGFELCPADTCAIGDAFCPAGEKSGKTPRNKFEIIQDFQTPDLEKYLELMRKNDLHVAAFEFITDSQGNRFTYDINTNTNYNSGAEIEGPKGMERIAESLGERFSKLCHSQEASCG